MKLLLQILWGWSVLANGAVGIEVGTIQTNNQNIKLMKTNFTSPVWLQSASNVGGNSATMSLVFSSIDPTVKLSTDGSIRVVSKKNGVTIRKTYDNLDNTAIKIDSDANSPILFNGNIIKIDGGSGPNYLEKLTSIDFLSEMDLSSLYIYQSKITNLDVSKLHDIKFLTAQDCNLLETLVIGELNSEPQTMTISSTAIKEIKAVATYQTIGYIVSRLISNATSVDGTVTLRQGDEFNQTIIDAAMEKGWDVQYYQ